MQKILRESQRTTALIDDLLRLARGDAGKETRPPCWRWMPSRSCATSPNRREPWRPRRDIDVQLHVEAAPLPVRADEASLRRLLLILVDNALKFTPPGGPVTIAGRRDATHVTISVADTGAGIAPDDLPHVFERFWRADKVRSRSRRHRPRPDDRQPDRGSSTAQTSACRARSAVAHSSRCDCRWRNANLHLRIC